MCCFSQPVELVAETNIFARSANGRQFLVYSMSYAASSDFAMVLPLPVPPNPGEDAVTFINLQRYPKFFDDMRRGFPRLMLPLARGGGAKSREPPKLRVHDVGDFEASFVPRLDDFGRLDERFRIPSDVWDRLPAYHDYGFAVFKLKASPSQRSAGVLRRSGTKPVAGRRKPRRVHPMAFTFPRRNPELLYFPTVHVHDRKVHRHALFDHMLYCQPDAAPDDSLQGWEESWMPASEFIDIARAEGIVDPSQSCWRLPLVGMRQNKDTLVGVDGTLP
jgi:hypothetical protein